MAYVLHGREFRFNAKKLNHWAEKHSNAQDSYKHSVTQQVYEAYLI